MGLPGGAAAGWSLSLYPDAGEGGGCLVVPRESTGWVPAGSARDPERSRREAARRARARLRRYCVANGLNRLGTLTYAGEGCHDPRAVRSHVGEFFRNLRGGLGAERMPYAWVPEWHHTDHGLHLHFSVGGYVKRSVIEAAWGRGFVSIKLLGDLPVGSTARDEARRAAGYLSKYVSKTFDSPERAVPGLHRYDLAQGFQPERVQLHGASRDDVLDQACEHMGAAPRHVWVSATDAAWDRPPAVWAQWA